MTLTRRLILGFCLLAMVLLTLPSLMIGAALNQFFHAQAVRETLDIAAYLQRRVSSTSYQPPLEDLTKREMLTRLRRWLTDYLVLDESLQPESVFFVRIRQFQSQQVVTTPNLEGADIPVQGVRPPYPGEIWTRLHGAIPVLLYRTHLQQRGREFAEVKVAVSMVEYNAILKQLMVFWLLGSLLALGLTGLLAWVLARQILKPLISLTQEIEGMVQSQTLGLLDSNILPPDQIRRLAQTFNTLLVRLSETIERQQRFVSDASHELRSPLTAIQGHAELLLKRGQSNPEILTEGLEIIGRESNRLGKLVEDLLLLAQLRHRKPRTSVFNLAGVARQVVESRQLLHENLSYTGDQLVPMVGDQNAIRRILLNLIDNALRFTPANAPIEVEVFLRGVFSCLVVRDHGSGIPSANLPYIFERFYRIEADRNRRQGGAGLGLSIVKELVEWHQGQLEVQSSESEGTTFTICFPAAAAPPAGDDKLPI